MANSTRSRGRAAFVRSLSLLLAVAISAVLLAATGVQSAHAAQPAPNSSTEQQLADKYSPAVVIRTQPRACGEGEPYLPVSVDTVLGNPTVVLRGPDGAVVKKAPTAADLAGKGEGYYLDFPGAPLKPRCDYETWFKAMNAAPTVYAHVVKQADSPDVLVLQYWLFWVFNDWNDKHEGDWEMLQLEFPAATAQQALAVPPTTVAFAQHEGSEVSSWDDPKLHRDGDHVAVYPGQGSHAAYFGQSRWFGKSAAAGFGCDDTTVPGTRINPSVVLMPDKAPSPTSSFGWLDFGGRWGEKAPSFNNGPTGPNTKTQWAQPVSWQADEGRPEAVSVPPAGGEAVTAFCGLTAAGSLLFIDLLDQPLLVIGALVLILILIIFAVRRTKWRGVAEPLVQQRRAGQIAGTAFKWWGRRAAVFGPLGLLLVVFAGTAAFLQSLLLAPVDSSDIASVGAPASAWEVLLALLVGVVLQFGAGLWLFSAAEFAVADEAAGRRPSVRRAVGSAARAPAGALVLLLMYLAVVGLAVTIVLLPVAAWLLARWAAASPAAVFEGTGVRRAFSRSVELTAGHRWRTLWLTLLLALVAWGIGGLLGTVLLLLTPWSFAICNLISALVVAELLMVAAIGLSLQFIDLRIRLTDTVDHDS